jgi:hypothetical protein
MPGHSVRGAQAEVVVAVAATVWYIVDQLASPRVIFVAPLVQFGTPHTLFVVDDGPTTCKLVLEPVQAVVKLQTRSVVAVGAVVSNVSPTLHRVTAEHTTFVVAVAG